MIRSKPPSKAYDEFCKRVFEKNTTPQNGNTAGKARAEIEEILIRALEGEKIRKEICLVYSARTWKALREAGIVRFTDKRFNRALKSGTHRIGIINSSIFGKVEAYIEMKFTTKKDWKRIRGLWKWYMGK